MVLTRAGRTSPGRRRRRHVRRRAEHDEPRHALRRPEPDLHVASLAPGLPARVRAQHRRQARRQRQDADAATTAAWRHGRSQVAGRDDARDPARGHRRRATSRWWPRISTDASCAARMDSRRWSPPSRSRRGQPGGPGGHPGQRQARLPPTTRSWTTSPTTRCRWATTTTTRRRATSTSTPDADTTGTTDDHNPATYDDEMLDAHFIAGDSRGNENIGLSAVHHIFHSEHNRLVDYIEQLILDQNIDVAEWRKADGAGGWNGERIFQAARFVTEMEYQHLVFEEFARKIQPGRPSSPRASVADRPRPGDQGRVRPRRVPLRALDADRHGVDAPTRTERRTTSRSWTRSSTRRRTRTAAALGISRPRKRPAASSRA